MVKFDRLIKPGDSGVVSLSVGMDKLGPFMKRAVVYTNDEKKKTFFLVLRGIVESSGQAAIDKRRGKPDISKSQ